MKSIINMQVKDYIRNWSNQEINTEYADVKVYINIENTNCLFVLDGDSDHYKVIRLVWELLSLYDGYFYKPISYEVDGNVKDCKELIKLGYFETDKKWYCSELIGRAERDLSTEVIKKYDEFRNKGIADKKMTKSVVNHCVMSDPASFRVQESGLTEMVFTDSIPYAKKCAKVKQLSIADMFAETIKRVMNNESISSQYII